MNLSSSLNKYPIGYPLYVKGDIKHFSKTQIGNTILSRTLRSASTQNYEHIFDNLCSQEKFTKIAMLPHFTKILDCALDNIYGVTQKRLSALGVDIVSNIKFEGVYLFEDRNNPHNTGSREMSVLPGGKLMMSSSLQDQPIERMQDQSNGFEPSLVHEYLHLASTSLFFHDIKLFTVGGINIFGFQIGGDKQKVSSIDAVTGYDTGEKRAKTGELQKAKGVCINEGMTEIITNYVIRLNGLNKSCYRYNIIAIDKIIQLVVRISGIQYDHVMRYLIHGYFKKGLKNLNIIKDVLGADFLKSLMMLPNVIFDRSLFENICLKYRLQLGFTSDQSLIDFIKPEPSQSLLDWWK